MARFLGYHTIVTPENVALIRHDIVKYMNAPHMIKAEALSKATIAEAVRQLLEEGLIREVPHVGPHEPGDRFFERLSLLERIAQAAQDD